MDMELWDDILNALKKCGEYLGQLCSVWFASTRKSAKNWCRPKNQRPRALFLDKRRKTYHCRNACAADYW